MEERYELICDYLQECVNNDIYTEEYASSLEEIAYNRYMVESDDIGVQLMRQSQNRLSGASTSTSSSTSQPKSKPPVDPELVAKKKEIKKKRKELIKKNCYRNSINCYNR